MKIIWSPAAVKNLEDIFEWLKEKNEQTAIDIYNKLFDAVAQLTEFPQMAATESVLSDFTLTYRSLVIKNYKIVYYIKNKTICISAVWDCRQNPKKLKVRIKGK
jgi:plasmid stabilization system protein ParE